MKAKRERERKTSTMWIEKKAGARDIVKPYQPEWKKHCTKENWKSLFFHGHFYIEWNNILYFKKNLPSSKDKERVSTRLMLLSEIEEKKKIFQVKER